MIDITYVELLRDRLSKRWPNAGTYSFSPSAFALHAYGRYVCHVYVCFRNNAEIEDYYTVTKQGARTRFESESELIEQLDILVHLAQI